MKLKFKLTPEQLKKPLLILGSLAVVLGIVTYFVVFYNPGYVAPNDSSTNSGTAMSAPTSTASSTVADATSTASSTAMAPAVVTWNENGNIFSLDSASFASNQLTFSLTSQSVDGANGCVPMNLSFVADESGTLQPPTSSSSTSPSPDGTCDADVIFTIDSPNFPLLFTTGGSSNTFFEVATSSASGTLQIELPADSG